jgi:Tfp pilus assembly protein PilO
MTGRDRLVLMGVVVLAILGAAWLMVVSPQRKKAKAAAAEVASAQSQLQSARSQLGTARSAQAKYNHSYATIVRLGKAVPTSQEVPSLIYELAQASKQKNVEFASIASTDTKPAASSSSSSSSSKSAGSSSASPSPSSSGSPATAAAGFQQMPFTFVFNGSYFGLEHMLHQLSGFATRRTSGALKVNGRLLTVKTVTLAPVSLQGHPNQLSATVTATAYSLPPELAQAAASGSGAQPASSSGGSGSPSSPTAPAVVGAKP